jgi:glutamate dehydrogenase (NAD(P)+)
VSIGGITGRREAAGLGVVYLIERAADMMKLPLRGARAIIQGFGAVGAVAAQDLAHRCGAKIVGLSDSTGACYNDKGIDTWHAYGHALERGDLRDFDGAERIDPDDLLITPCEVLIPAAIGGVITERNADKLRCRILAEAANGQLLQKPIRSCLSAGTRFSSFPTFSVM